jgi:histidyl-tRNA synthetase
MKRKNQSSNSIDFFIVYQQEEMIEESLRLALRLREVGLSIEVDLLRRSFTKQIKSADKSLTENIIIIGKDNFNNGTIVVKNMASGIEEIVSLKNNIDFFLKKTKGTPNEKK